MTDVRAALEIEARKRARYGRTIKRFVKAMLWIDVVAAVILFLRHPSFDEAFRPLAPALALVGASAGPSSTHRKAIARRFADRLPDMGPAEWRTIALNLARPRGKNAARILDLLHRSGTANSIGAFASSTSDDRLRTAAPGARRHPPARGPRTGSHGHRRGK